MNADYEILDYEVVYKTIENHKSTKVTFYNEDEAIAFIKKNIHNWVLYRLIKKQYAINNFFAE